MHGEFEKNAKKTRYAFHLLHKHFLNIWKLFWNRWFCIDFSILSFITIISMTSHICLACSCFIILKLHKYISSFVCI